MDLLDLFVRIGVKDEASDKVSSLGGKLKSGLATAGKVAAAGVGLVTGAATAAAGALLALEQSTEEYRIAQGKLNTAFEAAGYSADAAQQSYNAFYGILGDTDTATEASQLLAKLAQSEEDLSEWTNIAAGVYGTFGDSLPIEGLIESANETAKTGTVVGVLADSLNWAGISEDQFNEKLAAAGSESERNQLIMDTLSATYDEASDAFYRNNEALVASREAQAQMDAALASLGGAVSNIKTRLIGEFVPALSQVTEGLAGMLSGTEGAEEQFSAGIESIIKTGIEMLPQFLDFGLQIITSLAQGIVNNVPYLVDQLPTLVNAFLDFIIDNLPAIVESGVNIVVMLANGIIESVPGLVSRLPELTLAILESLGSIIDGVVDIGSNIVEGLWNGILSMSNWIRDKVTGFVDGIVDGIKGILGIHSPSTVFADVGKNMALGLGEGWDNQFSSIKNGIESGLSFGTASVDFASSGMGALSRQISTTSRESYNQTIDVTLEIDKTVLARKMYRANQNEAAIHGTSLVQGVT